MTYAASWPWRILPKIHIFNHHRHVAHQQEAHSPGDPSLLTLAAFKAIQKADLIIVDRLLPQSFHAFLDNCKQPSATIKFVRKPMPKPPKLASAAAITVTTEKSPQSPSSSCSPSSVAEAQSELLLWLHDALLHKHQHVVRLKNGDISLFARTIEEVIPFLKNDNSHISLPKITLIPGVSSALCAGWAAGVPLTHRGLANQVVIATGRLQERTSTAPSAAAAAAAFTSDMPPSHLADPTVVSSSSLPAYSPDRTLVLLMAVSGLADLIEGLKSQNGYPGTTQVVVVEKATCSEGFNMETKTGQLSGSDDEDEYVKEILKSQKRIRTTLDLVCGQIKEAGITHHATVIIGRVVGAFGTSDSGSRDVRFAWLQGVGWRLVAGVRE
jgi:uroporphyrin-III C-methyltransferase